MSFEPSSTPPGARVRCSPAAVVPPATPVTVSAAIASKAFLLFMSTSPGRESGFPGRIGPATVSARNLYDASGCGMFPSGLPPSTRPTDGQLLLQAAKAHLQPVGLSRTEARPDVPGPDLVVPTDFHAHLVCARQDIQHLREHAALELEEHEVLRDLAPHSLHEDFLAVEPEPKAARLAGCP